MEKENLIIAPIYLDDLWLYCMVIETYNPDNVLLQPFYAESEEELMSKGFEAIAHYKDEDLEDIMEMYEGFKFYWDGEGYYDIVGIVGGLEWTVAYRIESIMENTAYDINVNDLIYPEKVEERYGGKTYGVYGCITTHIPEKYKLKYIIVNDLEDYELEEPYSILENYGVKPNVYGVKGVANWNNYVCQRVTEVNKERLLDFLRDTESFSENEFDTIYLSKLYDKH